MTSNIEQKKMTSEDLTVVADDLNRFGDQVIFGHSMGEILNYAIAFAHLAENAEWSEHPTIKIEVDDMRTFDTELEKDHADELMCAVFSKIQEEEENE